MKYFLDIPILLLPLVLPMALGYFFRKVKVFDNRGADVLQTFVVKVSVPFLIFKNLYKADMRSLGQFFPLVAAYFLLMVLFTLAAYIAAPHVSPDKKKQNAFGFSLIMGNYAFLGWGVVYLFYGDDALTRGVLFTLMFWPFFLSCGFWLVHQRQPERTGSLGSSMAVLLKNAAVPVLASALGVGMNVLKAPLPVVVWDLVRQFASFTIPLILFTIGLNFKIRMPTSHFKVIASATFVRLVMGFGFGGVPAGPVRPVVAKSDPGGSAHARRHHGGLFYLLHRHRQRGDGRDYCFFHAGFIAHHSPVVCRGRAVPGIKFNTFIRFTPLGCPAA
jgi:predicted permease